VQDKHSVAEGPEQVKQDTWQLVQRGVGVYAGYYPALQELVHSEAVV